MSSPARPRSASATVLGAQEIEKGVPPEPPTGPICSGPADTVTQLENSDVPPAGLVAVAVAVTTVPAGRAGDTPPVNASSPSAFVDTAEIDANHVCPSPLPDGSQDALVKNSSRNSVFAVL